MAALVTSLPKCDGAELYFAVAYRSNLKTILRDVMGDEKINVTIHFFHHTFYVMTLVTIY